MLKCFIALSCVALIALSTGCETTRGFGKDVQNTGENLVQVVDKVYPPGRESNTAYQYAPAGTAKSSVTGESTTYSGMAEEPAVERTPDTSMETEETAPDNATQGAATQEKLRGSSW